MVGPHPLRLDLHLGVYNPRGATPRSLLVAGEDDHDLHLHDRVTEAVGGVGEAVASVGLKAGFMYIHSHIPLLYPLSKAQFRTPTGTFQSHLM